MKSSATHASVTPVANPADSRNIKDYALAGLTDWLTRRGEPAFRARQVFQWLYQRRVTDFDCMSNVGKPLRGLLEEHFHLGAFERHAVDRSTDGSRKYVFLLADGSRIESVLMPNNTHHTLCAVVEDVSHNDHVSGRQRIREEVSPDKRDPFGCCTARYVLLENRLDDGEVKADPPEVLVGLSDLNHQVSLSGTDVRDGFVVAPRQCTGDSHVGSVAEARHRFQEFPETCRISVERLKKRFLAVPYLVLGTPGS